MTVNPRWDQQIKVNRVEYDSMRQALCKPITKDLCPIILRLEHTVTELSKLSDQNQGEGGGRGREGGGRKTRGGGVGRERGEFIIRGCSTLRNFIR
jgi:hypothetical protein